MKNTILLLNILFVSSLFTGCVGTRNVLMMEQTNVGLNIDSKPPQTELSINRKEIAIQPGFEGGKTVASVMGFHNDGNFSIAKSFFFGAKDTFSTGKAAVMVTSPNDHEFSTEKDGISVSAVPVSESFSELGSREMTGPGTMRPMAFGSQTHFGVVANWDPETQLPSALKIGFNRKVTAYAPTTYKKASNGTYTVNIPSTLAALDTNVTTEKGGMKHGYTQYFATGAAAENLAAQDQIKNILIQRIEPAVEMEGAPDKNTSTLEKFIYDDKYNIVEKNLQKVTDWMAANEGGNDITAFLYAKKFAGARAKCVNELNH